MAEVVEELRALAKDLLTKGDVKVVIGYGKGSSAKRTKPLIITKPERAEALVWNKYCLNNLTVYLTRQEVMKHGKAAIVAKGCDIKTITCLIQENQLPRDRVVIIGMACDGQGDPTMEMCKFCDVHTPAGPGSDGHRLACDYVLGKATVPDFDRTKDEAWLAEVRKIEAMSLAERWAYWQQQFDRCVKCYACRQVCPLCYCKRCACEKNEPQWISCSAHDAGNFAWHVTRAMHLAGRCVGCEACERACPQNIPLTLMYKKMADSTQKHFQYRAGYDPSAAPAVKTFEKDDDNSFFK
jgi:ferredoxin